jgi:hypothetical protein
MGRDQRLRGDALDRFDDAHPFYRRRLVTLDQSILRAFLCVACRPAGLTRWNSDLMMDGLCGKYGGQT